MTPVLEQQTFLLTCSHEGDSHSPFEVLHSDLAHISRSGEGIVYYATCPHGFEHFIDDGVVPRSPELGATVRTLRAQIIENKARALRKALNDVSELRDYIASLEPLDTINW